VISLLRKNPDAAKEMGYGGNLPLHAGLRFQASTNVIVAALAAHPAAAKEKGSLKELPLHYGLRWNAAADVIAAVLAAHPAAAKEQDDSGRLPLQLARGHGHSADTIDATVHAFPAAQLFEVLESEGPSPATEVKTLLKKPSWAKEKDGGVHLPLHHGLFRKAPADVIAAALAAHPAAAKEKNNDGNLPLHHGLRSQAPADAIAVVLAAHLAAAKEKNNDGDLPLTIARASGCSAETIRMLDAAFPAPELIKNAGTSDAICAALGDPVRALSAKHDQRLGRAALAAANALVVGRPWSHSTEGLGWVAAMLSKAPADPNVKRAALQMLGNSHRFAVDHPSDAARRFKPLKAAADKLLNRSPSQLHAHAVEVGAAVDIGPRKLHNASASQRGVLAVLEPWFAEEVQAGANRNHGLADVSDPHEIMLALLCVVGHVMTAHLKKAHPTLGAKFGSLLWADAKTINRMRIKWKLEHGGDFGALLDFVRFSLTSPDQAAQNAFLAAMQAPESKFAIRRIKSTHSDPSAQVKQCLVNLEWAPGLTFGELMTAKSSSMAIDAAGEANQGVSGDMWICVRKLLGSRGLKNDPDAGRRRGTAVHALFSRGAEACPSLLQSVAGQRAG